jgi:hypothetical protein
MHSIRAIAVLPLLAALLAFVPLSLSGCGSEPASAKNGSASAGDGQSAASAESKPAKRPGALTEALSAAGDRPYDKTFDDIRFDMDPAEPFVRSMLPSEIESLAGRRIRIRGFILPTPQKRGIKQFVLVRDNQECCFGQGAALFDCILVELAAGKTAEFTIRPVAVEGTFDIREFRGPDGRHLAIYHLEAESVD